MPGVVTVVADTIGAGDTFMASLIDDYLSAVTALPHSQDPDLGALSLHALGTRAAAAALTVSRPGADLPWTAELTTTTPTASP